MKRIIVIIIFAMLLIPGVNAQELDDRQTETTTKYGLKTETVGYGYNLDPQEDQFFELDSRFNYLSFCYTIDANLESIVVYDIFLTRIIMSCLFLMDADNLTESTLSTYAAVTYKNGTVFFDGNPRINHTTQFLTYNLMESENYGLFVKNLQNVSLITCIMLEFHYQFKYDVTRYVELDQSESIIISILSIAVIFFLFLGVSVGMWYRPYWDGTKEF